MPILSCVLVSWLLDPYEMYVYILINSEKNTFENISVGDGLSVIAECSTRFYF